MTFKKLRVCRKGEIKRNDEVRLSRLQKVNWQIQDVQVLDEAVASKVPIPLGQKRYVRQSVGAAASERRRY
jgi:hypothetical protein